MRCTHCGRTLKSKERIWMEREPTGTHDRAGLLYCDPCWRDLTKSLSGPKGVQGPPGED